MAKISVSIPDELKDKLDRYAADTGFKRSEAVAHILTAFFAGEIRSPEPIDPDRIQTMEHQLGQVLDYLSTLHRQDPENHPRPDWLQDEERRPRSFISRTIHDSPDDN